MTYANHDIEQAVIGTLLADREVAANILTRLNETDFHDQTYQSVFKAARSLRSEGKPISIDTVSDYLNGGVGKDELDDLRYFSSPQDIAYHIEAVKEKAARRFIRQETGKMLEMMDDGMSADEALPILERIARNAGKKSSVPGKTLGQIWDEMDKDEEEKEEMSMGIEFFDTTFYPTVGRHKGTTEVIFGYTKHGKSWYALFKTGCFIRGGYRGLYIVTENTKRNPARRFRQRFGQNSDYRNRLIIVDKRSGIRNLQDVLNCIRYWDAKRDLDFVVVDYMQRIPVQEVDYSNKVDRIESVSNLLTDAIIELDLFGMLVAQPNRTSQSDWGGKGYDKEPKVHHMYGSSAIERDAYLMTSVFRPSRHDELRIEDHEGKLTHVKSPTGDRIDKHSVFVRQVAAREDPPYTGRFRFIHTDKGFRLASTVKRERSRRDY